MTTSTGEVFLPPGPTHTECSLGKDDGCDQLDQDSLVAFCFTPRQSKTHEPLPTDMTKAVDKFSGSKPLDDIHSSGAGDRPKADLQNDVAGQNNKKKRSTKVRKPAVKKTKLPPQQIQTTVPAPNPRQNEYNMRAKNLNIELHSLQTQGKVELTYSLGDEHGLGGGRVIRRVKIDSSVWEEVISLLNESISSKSSKPGTLSENLRQCLRYFGLVPRMRPGRKRYCWRQPPGWVWEFSQEEWELQQELVDKSNSKKRKREEAEAEAEAEEEEEEEEEKVVVVEVGAENEEGERDSQSNGSGGNCKRRRVAVPSSAESPAGHQLPLPPPPPPPQDDDDHADVGSGNHTTQDIAFSEPPGTVLVDPPLSSPLLLAFQPDDLFATTPTASLSPVAAMEGGSFNHAASSSGQAAVTVDAGLNSEPRACWTEGCTWGSPPWQDPDCECQWLTGSVHDPFEGLSNLDDSVPVAGDA